METVFAPRTPKLRDLRTQPQFFPWLDKQIKHLKELQSLLHAGDVSFLALDTEVMKDRDLVQQLFKQPDASFEPCTEIGLALLYDRRSETTFQSPQSAEKPPKGEDSKPSLQDLATRFGIRPKCVHVIGRDEFITENRRRRRPQEPLVAGDIDDVAPSDLNDHIDAVVKRFKEEAGGRPLVLVGYSVGGDIQRMYTEFPKAARHIDAWADLDGVLRCLRNPGIGGYSLGGSLAIMGYSRRNCADLNSSRRPWRHCAGMDALRTVALLEGLRSISEDVAVGLRLARNQQSKMATVNVRAWDELDDRYVRLKRRYAASVKPLGSTGLPVTINSAVKLAHFMQVAGYSPLHVIGHGCSRDPAVPRNGRVTGRNRRTGGTLIFRSEKELMEFVSNMNGLVLDGVRVMVTSLFDPVFAQEHKERIEKRNNAQRTQRKGDRDHAPFDIWSVENFGFDGMGF
ncbi:hypothetical protein F4780DRAFT_211082 [Xylariomycetidae sp. FL0641]|nr:hypothetical protein F4780DRAFT_211082 [Xylariomycetidae sp. FL0641]